MITKEIYEMMSPLEHHFHTATKAQYVRGLGRTDGELIKKVWKEIYGKEFTKKLSCNVCAYNTVLELAKYYYEYEENKAEQEVKEVKEVQPKKKKGGRPKKKES